MGGKDPPTLELIQKIQTLQKRLIARKEDIVDRETSIREKVILSKEFVNVIDFFYHLIGKMCKLLEIVKIHLYFHTGACHRRVKGGFITPTTRCNISR